MSAKLPALVGLCPGEHLTHFYMPLDPGESRVCPECDCELVVYVPVRDDEVTLERPAWHGQYLDAARSVTDDAYRGAQ